MRRKWIIITLFLAGVIAVVYGVADEPHEFLSGDCGICHVDAENDPLVFKTDVTGACATCHLDIEEIQSHPTDLYPALSVPEDMPLIDGMLKCITCHYAHPKKKRQLVKKHYFLRRQVRGPLFCNICHELNERGHVVMAKVHIGTYTVTDRATRIDRVSMECIECHDDYINEPDDFLGAGKWDHMGRSRLSHPIGSAYKEISMKKMRKYNPPDMLRKEINFFDGKIGCGTCHSIYSGRKNMLVMDNTGSRLCMECHIK